MRKFVCLTVVATLALAGCGQAEPDALETGAEASTDYGAAANRTESTAEMPAQMATDTATGGALPDLAAIEVNLPKLAYVYDLAFRMPGEDIGNLQRRHADLCEQQGPTSCQIVGMSKSGEEADTVTGELQLAVATRHARAFGALLEKEATDIGADQLSAEIAAEERSKQIVDTEAHLRARTLLRDRLTEILRTRDGDVTELVEAERSVAQVNQEIDQARSWLLEMRGRISFSRMTVRYETGQAAGGDFVRPIASAFGSLGSILGFVIAGLMLLAAVALPIAAVVWAGRWTNRRFGRAEKFTAF